MAPRKKLPDIESKKPIQYGDRLIRNFLAYYAETIPDQQKPARATEERVDAALRALVGGKDGPKTKIDNPHLRAIHMLIKDDPKLLPQTAAKNYVAGFTKDQRKEMGETSEVQMADRLAKAYRKLGSDSEKIDFKFAIEDYADEYDAQRMEKLCHGLHKLLHDQSF